MQLAFIDDGKNTIATQLVDRLREAIVSGQLEAGSKINLERARESFEVKEVSADAIYASQDNFNAVAAIGATPYIAFKENTTGGVGGLFAKAFHYYCAFKDEFLAHYHKRSNAESTFSMIKAKFGDGVRSKTDVAMVNEALCKILCHNICCLIQSFFELGIEATRAIKEELSQLRA